MSDDFDKMYTEQSSVDLATLDEFVTARMCGMRKGPGICRVPEDDTLAEMLVEGKDVGYLVARLPEEVADMLITYSAAYLEGADVARDVDSSPPHVTIRWGVLSPPDVVQKFVREVPVNVVAMVPIGISLFENKDYDVIKIDVGSLECESLHAWASSELECLPLTYKEYKPHITLGYLKKGTGKAYLEKFGTTPLRGTIHVDHLMYSAPGGKEYKCPLGGRYEV